MRWTVGQTRTLYQDLWIHLQTADIEAPGGQHFDHRMIRSANGAYAVIVVDGHVLLLWRHRFIPDTWGWEVPGGRIEPGEQPAAAAARETIEETGWRPEGALEPFTEFFPMAGLVSAHHHVFLGSAAVWVGPPADEFESDRIAWVPVEDLRGLIDAGEVSDGTTLLALLALLDRIR